MAAQRQALHQKHNRKFVSEDFSESDESQLEERKQVSSGESGSKDQ
jgi:hypothetical protein